MKADRVFMERALELAHRGAGLVSPNPMVGAVLVRGTQIVGEGFHRYDLLKHAESYAIEMAGPLARGATLYCSLEPCCHHGRTPPCTEALIRAGINRAVIALADPNPQVFGHGIDQLRAAAIEVEVGLLEREAIRLNEYYLKYIQRGIPFVHKVIVDAGDSSGPELAKHLGDEPATVWQPSGPLREMVSEYDAVVLGALPAANRSIVDSCLARNRHRPLIIAGAREYISEFIRTQSSQHASVSDGGDLEQPSSARELITGSNAIFVELGTADAASQRTALTREGEPSTNSRPGRMESAPGFDALLETLARMRVTSALVLPFGIDARPDSIGADQVDRLTVVQKQPLSGESDSDSLSGLDSVLDCSLVHETSNFIEVTGRFLGRAQGPAPGHGDFLDQA